MLPINFIFLSETIRISELLSFIADNIYAIYCPYADIAEENIQSNKYSMNLLIW